MEVWWRRDPQCGRVWWAVASLSCWWDKPLVLVYLPFHLRIRMQMVRVCHKNRQEKKRGLEILHTGQRKGGTYFFRFYPLIRDYVSLISTSVIFILLSQFLELLHPRSSKWSRTYAMRPAFVNFRKECLLIFYNYTFHFLLLVGNKRRNHKSRV